MVLTNQSSHLSKLLLKPGRWTVGSAATCSHRFVGVGVQPRHALILCGGQSTVLKTWDARTWCNGQPVQGEVKLKHGDTVVIGSIELEVELVGVTDSNEQLPEAQPDLPSLQRGDFSPTVVNPAPEITAADDWEMLRLKDQIQELRGELTPHTEPHAFPSSSAAEATFPKVTAVTKLESEELLFLLKQVCDQEVAAAALRHEVEQARQNVDAVKAELAQQKSAWTAQFEEWSRERSLLLEENETLTDQWLQSSDDTSANREADLERHSEQHLIALRQLAEETEQLRAKQIAFQKQAVELELVRVNQAREKKVLQHSWEWLQADRRQLVVEKKQWMTTRDQWAEAASSPVAANSKTVDSKVLQAEKVQWEQERGLIEAEVRRVAYELEVAHGTVAAQQEEMAEEWARLQAAEEALHSIRTELDLRSDAIAAEQQSLESQRQKVQAERQAVESDRQALAEVRQTTARIEIEPEQPKLPSLADVENQESSTTASVTTVTRRIAIIHDDEPQTDSWSIGVDLTDRCWNEFTAFPRTNSVAVSPETADEPAEDWDVAASVTDEDTASRTVLPSTEFSEIETPSAEAWPQQTTESTIPTPLVKTAAGKLSEAVAIVDPAAAELRLELARMFNLRELERSVPTMGEDLEDDAEIAEEPVLEALPIAESHSDFIAEQTPDSGEEAVDDVGEASDTPSPSLQNELTKEPLSFSDDEHIDDSVSRYMQHLMARTPGWTEQDSSVEVKKSLMPTGPQIAAPQSAWQSSSTNGATESITAVPVALQSPLEPETEHDRPSRKDGEVATQPAHKQNKDALRAVTENMRAVANLQTLKNVEVAAWARLKGSLKTKCALAAFAFLLSLGLLYMGVRSKPEFIALGTCAACIGVLTWIDLFIAIYKVQRRGKLLGEQHRKRK